MASPEDKAEALKQDFRVLGVNICGSLCQFEDADFKRSLVVHHLPYGIEVSKVFEFLSEHLYEGSPGLTQPASSSSRCQAKNPRC